MKRKHTEQNYGKGDAVDRNHKGTPAQPNTCTNGAHVIAEDNNKKKMINKK